jgi:carbonic anhydrase
MKKLLHGIVDFQNRLTPEKRELFARMALKQSPDVLLFSCSDSRVAPNVFASTDPGDMFVIRNVGNMIPPCDGSGLSTADESEAAAIEFGMSALNVGDIVVCGHSECGAIEALRVGRHKLDQPNLKAWLRHGDMILNDVESASAPLAPTPWLTELNRKTQLNVLLQVEHLKTYPGVRERLESKQLRIHAWWFELHSATVYTYEPSLERFIIIDQEYVKKTIGE